MAGKHVQGGSLSPCRTAAVAALDHGRLNNGPDENQAAEKLPMPQAR
jgi:hypothetical protein